MDELLDLLVDVLRRDVVYVRGHDDGVLLLKQGILWRRDELFGRG